MEERNYVIGSWNRNGYTDKPITSTIDIVGYKYKNYYVQPKWKVWYAEIFLVSFVYHVCQHVLCCITRKYWNNNLWMTFYTLRKKCEARSRNKKFTYNVRLAHCLILTCHDTFYYLILFFLALSGSINVK